MGVSKVKEKKNSIYAYAQLQRMWALPLENKIKVAKHIIRNTFKQGKKVALAFSGGKDSTALWHLIRETCPEEAKNMIVIFSNTGVEYKESLMFARKLGKEWGGCCLPTRSTKLLHLKCGKISATESLYGRPEHKSVFGL